MSTESVNQEVGQTEYDYHFRLWHRLGSQSPLPTFDSALPSGGNANYVPVPDVDWKSNGKIDSNIYQRLDVQ